MMFVSVKANANNMIYGTINHDGMNRSYIGYIPDNYNPEVATSLILAFHGGLGSGVTFMKQTMLDKQATKKNFIIIFPNGTSRKDKGRYVWNAGNCCGYASRRNVDDIGFVKKLITKIKSEYSINSKNIYATGFSNGGSFSYRLACELSDQISAIAVVSSGLGVKNCKFDKPVSVLHIHGTADRNYPYNGGKTKAGFAKIDKTSIKDSLAVAINSNNCMVPPVRSKREDLQYYYYHCKKSKIAHIKINDGGHLWAGGSPTSKRRGEKTTKHLDASKEVIKFFSGLNTN